MTWLLVGLASVALLFSVRTVLLDQAMVRAISARDPTFRAGRFNPDRGWVWREYRRRFPDGDLNVKMRHVAWATGGVFAAFIVVQIAAHLPPR